MPNGGRVFARFIGKMVYVLSIEGLIERDRDRTGKYGRPGVAGFGAVPQ